MVAEPRALGVEPEWQVPNGTVDSGVTALPGDAGHSRCYGHEHSVICCLSGDSGRRRWVGGDRACRDRGSARPPAPTRSRHRPPWRPCFQAAVADGRTNLWGTPLAFIEPESEHSSASAAEGFALAGGRVTNFTAGQGLVLMKEVLYVIAGKRLPVVFHVGARALTSQGLNIHAGHDDVMGVADTGWGILFARNAAGGSGPDRDRPTHGRGVRDAVHRRPGRLPDDPHARERPPARGRAARDVRRGTRASASATCFDPGSGTDDRRRAEPGLAT